MMTQNLIWSIGLMGLAALFFLLEFMVPSAGLLGIGAAMAAIAALFLAYTESLQTGFTMTGVAALGIPVVFLVAIRVWPHTPIGRRILNLPPLDESGETEASRLSSNPHRELLGKIGKARSDMLPSGMVEIEGRRFDAVAIGMAIDRDQYVEVISVDAGKIRVRKSDRRPAADVGPPSAVTDQTLVEGRTLDDLNLDDFK